MTAEEQSRGSQVRVEGDGREDGAVARVFDRSARRRVPPERIEDLRRQRDICSVVVVVVDVVPPGISFVKEVCFVSVDGSACRGATCTSSQLLSEH